MRTRLLPTLSLIAILGLALPADAKRTSPCPDGRFLAPDGVALLGSVARAGRDAVSLGARKVGIDGGCAPRKATITATKKATRLSVRWSSCGDKRKVRLKAVIAAPACDTLQGKVSARKTPGVTFTAARSVCGDGYADTAGGETCDGSGSSAEPTLEILDAAHDQLTAGADDVALSPDGTLRFRRTRAGGVTTEEVVRGSTVFAQWVHSGDTTTASADGNGDGVIGTVITAERAPARRATVSFDLDGDGTPDTTETLVQDGPDSLQAQITGAAPATFATTVLQEAGPVVPRANEVPCTPDTIAKAKTATNGAITNGLACLRRLGLDDFARIIAAKKARDGVRFACDDSDRCAQMDVLDGLTGGALPSPIDITLGPKFGPQTGACSNSEMVIFHELLHLATGGVHSPTLDRTTFQGLATDRVYSCTDLCYRPGLATKCECATCLGVDRCHPKCAAFADCPDVGGCDAAVAITKAECPPVACQCCTGASFCNGTFWTNRMEGTASGPVGATLRVNFVASLGGDLQCPGWTKTPCPPAASTLNCCTRTSAQQPQQTTFVATLPAVPPFSPIQCICPPPSPVQIGYVAQVGRSDVGAAVEDTRQMSCPQ